MNVQQYQRNQAYTLLKVLLEGCNSNADNTSKPLFVQSLLRPKFATSREIPSL